jgi:1-deoxy-D-xylulose-5-phosphate synthase
MNVENVNTALLYKGPVAVRYPRGNTYGNEILVTDEVIEIGKSLTVYEGKKIALLVFGHLINNLFEISKEAVAYFSRHEICKTSRHK